MTAQTTLVRDIPLPLPAVLMRLRWPAAEDAMGLTAWSRIHDTSPKAVRTNAWVKWDGENLEAELTQGQTGANPEILNLRWKVSPAGAAEFIGARDKAGPMVMEQALDRFTEAVATLGRPSFVAHPIQPRRRFGR